jgi:hypothetical protein
VTDNHSQSILPTRRVHAMDGMAVTADVWGEAHDYHHRHALAHARYGHGAGILGGLDVVAGDPPDTTVYIRPGLALDPVGQPIILNEPLTYDIAQAQAGPLYLLLSYSESLPRLPEADGVLPEGTPMYVHSQYGVDAVTALPRGPHVELARVRRSERGAVVRNALDPQAPGLDEIDLRFRRQAGLPAAAPAALGVAHLGGAGDTHTRGARHLARALRAAGRTAWVDDAVALRGGLESYSLLYLVGHNGFTLAADEMNALYAYLQGGGTVLAEACRRDAKAATAAEKSFNDLFASLGLRLEDLPAGHALLHEPNLFAAPPAGFETDAGAGLRLSGGLIFSTADYGCLWGGERRSGAAGREAIRAAHEFGANMLAYAEGRRPGEISRR